MDNIKITATFIIPGRTMFTEEECEQNKSFYDFNQLQVDYHKNKSEYVHETIHFHTRGTKHVKQVINMPQETYDYFIATPVAKTSVSHWKRLPNGEKIKMHLTEQMHDMGAIKVNFIIHKD